MRTVFQVLAAVFAVASAFAQSEVHEVTIAVTDPVLAGKGPGRSLAYRVRATGSLHVWAESSEFDPCLRVEAAGGGLLGWDDDSGGGTAAFATAPVDAGLELVLRIAAEATGGAGAVRVHVVELPESDATRELTRALKRSIEDSAVKRAEGEHDAARKILRDVFERLKTTPGAATSAGVIDATLRVLEDAYHLDDTRFARDIAEFRYAAMESCFPPDSGKLQLARFQFGGLLTETRDSARGTELIERATEIARRTLAPDDPELYAALAELGQIRVYAGELDEAIALQREAVAGLERIGTANPKTLETARMSLAVALLDAGELEEARALGEQVVAAFEHLYGEDDPFRVTARSNLASTLSALGDHQAALALQQELLAIVERVAPANSEAVLTLRMNMGVQMLALGRATEARIVFAHVVELSRGVAGWSAAHDVRSRTNLAVALDDLGLSAEALAVLEAVQASPEWSVAGNPDLLWRALGETAIALCSLGRTAEALTKAEQALALLDATVVPDAPDHIDFQNLTAKLALATGDRQRARALIYASADSAKTFFAQCAATMPSRQAEAVQFNWSRLVADALHVLANSAEDATRPRANALALELVESARNVSSAALKLAHANADDSMRAGVERLRGDLRRRSRAIAAAAARGDNDAVRAFTSKREESERELKAMLARSSSAEMLDVDSARIAASLAPDEAAISVWSYEDRGSTARHHVVMPSQIVAFVLRRSGPTARVELGAREPLRTLCDAWRVAVLADDADAARKVGEELRKKLVDPLRPALGDATSWHVALDDALHLVALEALPEGEGLLGDRVRVMVTPTLCDLLQREATIARAAVFVGVGGVDYDHAPEDTVARALDRPGAPDTLALRSGLRGDFTPLWETSDEIGAIAALYKQRSGDARVELLEERYATKSALARLAPSASFLHVATHGFFAPESVRAIGDAAANTGFDPLSTPQSAVSAAGFAPLALCGLALSGANLPPREHESDEGIVTAEELAALDLSNCELVVLSACDTNVGFVRAGRGVASFQKALHAAGARSVITSMWRVSDAATRDLMIELYQGLWRDGLTKSRALWRAKQTLRARRAPLRDWAGWVLSGAE